MADWSKPTITSNYVTFVDEVKNRDIDAITLQVNPLTNPPVSAIKLLRSPAKFQEWNGTAFVDIVLSVAGGGTGASTPAGAASGLGLGSMAFQNSNAINVTGGDLYNIRSHRRIDHDGVIAVAATAGDGGGSAIYISGIPGAYTQYILGGASGLSYGLYVVAGFGGGDIAMAVVNRNQNRNGLVVDGAMVVTVPWRLGIPVGVDYWIS